MVNEEWPKVSYEKRQWRRDPEEYASRRQKMRASGDYGAAVVPKIADLKITLQAELYAAADDATREISRFDASSGVVAAPFANILLRTESASSSQIENLTSSAKQVALANLGAQSNVNSHLIVANVRAMQAALKLADRIDEASIIEMQKQLLQKSAPSLTGNFREEQVWIGGSSFSPHGADFIPPHQDRVEEAMRDLVGFMNRTDIPVLIHAAIAHAQFETIHPFADGNGRTGRVLVHSMLYRDGVTKNMTLPVSAGLLSDTKKYFGALTAFREGNPKPIIGTFIEASFVAVKKAESLVHDLQEIEKDWHKISARKGSTTEGLRTLLLTEPAVTVATVAEHLNVSEVAAAQAIKRYEEEKVLIQATSGRRNRVWIAPEILDVLDSFAATIKR